MSSAKARLSSSPGWFVWRLLWGRGAVAGWLMIIGGCAMFWAYWNWVPDPGTFVYKAYGDCYNQIDEDWSGRANVDAMRKHLNTGEWEPFSLMVFRAVRMRWNLRNEYPELFSNLMRDYERGSWKVGKRADWERLMLQVDDNWARFREVGRAHMAGKTAVEIVNRSDKDLWIRIKNSGVTPLAGPVIRLVVDLPLYDDIARELPVMRWCLDDKLVCDDLHSRPVTWRQLPSPDPQRLRAEFVFDMSCEPQWMNPKTKPALLLSHTGINQWRVVSLEDLDYHEGGANLPGSHLRTLPGA